MSSNLSVPETGSSGPSGRSDESEGYPSISDDLRRLRTGKRGRPPIDPTQKGLVEVCLELPVSFSLCLTGCLTGG
jgi:hypothetical protein